MRADAIACALVEVLTDLPSLASFRNQHLRVHRLEKGGEILNGLSVGSDGVLRREVTGEYVAPGSLGLRNVELLPQDDGA